MYLIVSLSVFNLEFLAKYTVKTLHWLMKKGS